MLALMEPLKPALDADEAATTFEVTYTPDAKGHGTIQIPVSISSDGASLAVKCPPVAIPIGTWILDWNFTIDPVVAPVTISISNLLGSNELLVPSQPTETSSLWSAVVTNKIACPAASDPLLPPPPATVQPVNGCGYFIQVQSNQGSRDSALGNFTLAAVQTEIPNEAGVPASFKVTYPKDLGQTADEKTLQITVAVSLASDGSKFVVKCPPAALPIGPWNIVWNFDLPAGMSMPEVILSRLVDVDNYFGVVSQPTQNPRNPTQFGAAGTNQLHSPDPLPNTISLPNPVSQMMSGFGYTIQVADNKRVRGAIQRASHDPSIAVVQDPIVG